MTEITTFETLGLSDNVLRAVSEAGYATPTEIQTKAIPWILQGRDVIGVARTGTGKTASFTLPMIEILAGGVAKARMPRALVLTPTRELAAQIADNFDKYGLYSPLSRALIVGGVGMAEQITALTRGVDVLIATPGRLLDLFERGNILLSDIKILVIDEADRMLDMGFIPDIERIGKMLPVMRQTLLFSATMAPPIQKLAEQFLSNPRSVTVAPQSSPAETVAQNLVHLKSAKEKVGMLLTLLTDPAVGVSNAFVFCNRKTDVSMLAKFLGRKKISVAELHGDMPQVKRMETLQRFKDGGVQILVCSDVAARGLDISGVSHVFNFDVPFHAEDYVHRIGRTGRAGKTGVSYTLATDDDAKFLENITRLIKKEIPPMDAAQFAALVSPDSGARDDGDAMRPRGNSRSKPARADATPPAEAQPKQVRAPRASTHTRTARTPHAGRPARTETSAVIPAVKAPVHHDVVDDDGAVDAGFGDHLPAFMGIKSR